MLSRDLLARTSLGFPVEPWGKGERTHFHQGGEDRRALYEAIAAGEPECAEQVARRHFMISPEMIRDVLTRVQASDPPRPRACRSGGPLFVWKVSRPPTGGC